MSLKKGHVVVGGVTAKATAALLKARAEALSLTPSKYIGLLLEEWVTNGAPPVSKPDAVTMQGLETFLIAAQNAYPAKPRNGLDVRPETPATLMASPGTHVVRDEPALCRQCPPTQSQGRQLNAHRAPTKPPKNNS